MKPIAAKLRFALFCAILLVSTSCATQAKKDKAQTPVLSPPTSLDLDAELPIDPAVKRGTLPNGITYYVRENDTPQNRAELRLVVNAGSVLEDEDQLGLAHFIEHMAFNGTAHFEKQKIVDYLESIGMRFGPDLNAYTTFDETVYMLQVPTDDIQILKTAVTILEEWAHLMTLETEEIDKERGVIVEEWRLGRDADARMRETQYPLLFFGSRYAERLPIGKMEVIRNFDPAVLKRFYRDWYRPDLMAVVAVGDFDANALEKIISDTFSRIPPPESPRQRPAYPVPDHDETLIAVATDTEATVSSIGIVSKRDTAEFRTVRDYRRLLLEALCYRMLDERLWERSKQPDPPYLAAYSGAGRYVRSKEFSIVGARVNDSGIFRGFEALFEETEKVRRFGFTKNELERQKKEMLAYIESAYKERDKTESDAYASEYTGHYLEGDPIPGIEYEYKLYRRFLPEVSLLEINERVLGLFSDRNRVLLVNAPRKAGVNVPDKGELSELAQGAAQMTVERYSEDELSGPLLPELPAPGRIVEQREIEELGLVEWKLQNGVRVILKPTDFKNDEVLFSAFSPGGESLVPDSDYIAAATAAEVVEESGIGSYTLPQLLKTLTGSLVSVSPWTNELFEGLEGYSAPADIETMFQLVYLYFTGPRLDETAFDTVKNRIEADLKNRESDPEQTFWDTFKSLLGQNHFRSRPWTLQTVSGMDAEKSFLFYTDRFSEASDFTFIFVGSFAVDEMRPLVERYLGSLPAGGRIEEWKDLGIDPPDGIVREEVTKGMEPKSLVSVVFNGETDWTLEKAFLFSALEDLIEIPLRETIREEEGGAYSLWVYSSIQNLPDDEYYIYVGFGCDPDRAEELTAILFSEIEKLKENGPRETDMQKTKEILTRERETNLKENGFWIGVLQTYYLYGLDPRRILEYDEFVRDLDAKTLHEALRRYLDTGRYVQVTLYPESRTED
ncbi:MAG: insulinase family protein [Spirochaetes bacterium]|nr:insulinase family protein [Spirochaetota bacterium]